MRLEHHFIFMLKYIDLELTQVVAVFTGKWLPEVDDNGL